MSVPAASDFPAMSPPDFDPQMMSEEALERQCSLKQQAAEALDSGNLELALDKYTGAIVLGTDSALLYSRRAQVLLQLGRVEATINDCNASKIQQQPTNEENHQQIIFCAVLLLCRWGIAQSLFYELCMYG